MSTQKEEIITYFQELDRSYFIEGDTDMASMDIPVPIGFGQTISQPTLVLRMTLELDLQPDSRVLEIGTGSGYQTAMLAPFCKEVYTVERIETLYHQAKKRLVDMEFSNIYFELGDGSLGWPEHGPYDRIIVTASAMKVPDELLEQLDIGGKLLIPVGDHQMQQLQMIEKDQNGKVTTSILGDVAFVRLKGKYE